MLSSFSSPGFVDGFNGNRNGNYDNYKKSQFKAEQLEQAEKEMYYDIYTTANPGHFNTETLCENSKEVQSYHKTFEPFDHASFLTDQVVDERIKKNHFSWVDEVTPWAGTASVVGLGEFSAGDYLNYQGLRRPRGVKQIDPWQITEVDENDLKDNKPFTI
jgi:hypothetical protein